MEALGDKANTVGRAELDENLFLGTQSTGPSPALPALPDYISFHGTELLSLTTTLFKNRGVIAV